MLITILFIRLIHAGMNSSNIKELKNNLRINKTNQGKPAYIKCLQIVKP